MNKQQGTIKVEDLFKGYGSNQFRMVGVVVEHPNKNLIGLRCTTSPLVRIDFEKGEAETANTLYKLVENKHE